MTRFLMCSIAALVLGCGGGDDDPFVDADPRCAATCAIETPPIEGAFDVCSIASASSCVDQCEVRIADVPSLCATCLLEAASFHPDGQYVDRWCTYDSCTIEGPAGSCTYPATNEAAEEDCIRQVYPRREVDCEVQFRSVTECAEVCG